MVCLLPGGKALPVQSRRRAFIIVNRETGAVVDERIHRVGAGDGFVIVNRETGAKRRLDVRRVLAAGAAILVSLAVASLGYGLWEFSAVRQHNAQLNAENDRYRGAASVLNEQMTSLQAMISDLAGRVDDHPALEEALERLPGSTEARKVADQFEDLPQLPAFNHLGLILGLLEDVLAEVQRGVAYREAVAAATPVMRPVQDGWTSGGYGYRTDPFTGERTFHAGIDISTASGRPVIAAAPGKVIVAARNGPYGNLVEIDHGFGLTTRYGHLSEFAVEVGTTVELGQIIGRVGATGRATGAHVHFEIRSNGRPINPMRLLNRPAYVSAN